MVNEGAISSKDLGLFQIVNEPQQVLQAILKFYQDNGLDELPGTEETHPAL